MKAYVQHASNTRPMVFDVVENTAPGLDHTGQLAIAMCREELQVNGKPPERVLVSVS